MKNTRQMDAQASQVDSEIEGARQEQLGGQMPPATEPLSAGALEALGETVRDTILALTNGEVPEEKLGFQPVQGDQQQIPPDIGARVQSLQAMIEKMGPQVPELEKYRFDVQELGTTNSGIQELANTIDQLGRDKKVIKAMQAPIQETEQETPAAEVGEES